jgi:hypothetical protein
MATTSLNQRFYRYLVESFDVLFEGEQDPVKIQSQYVNSIVIEKDYDNDYFPLLRVKVMLDTELYYKIIGNKDTVRFRFRMQKYVYDSTSAIKFKKNVFNELFCIFLDENTPFIEKKMLKETKDMLGEGNNPQNTGGKEFTFYLFKEKDLNSSKEIINKVIGPVNIMGAVTYCLATAGFSNILIAPFDNKTDYDEILIPPLTFLGNLDYLDNQYGFFENGMMAFFDIDRVYMIDYSGECKAWANEEYKKTILNVKFETNPDNLSPGTYDDPDEKNFVINIAPGGIAIKAASVVADQTVGNNIHFVDPSTGDVNTHTSAITTQRGKGTYRVVIDKYNNRFRRISERKRREELRNIAEIMIADFDIDAISPNKEFMLTYEDSSLNLTHGGNYRVSNSLITFIKQGEEFSISSTSTFKKTL